MSQLSNWATRHGVSAIAMQELKELFGIVAPTVPAPADPMSEAYTQSMVRLEAAQKRIYLFRNNVGVLKDDKGRPIRYGLANDSPAVNERIKSADLIGWRPVLIEHYHLGTTIAQFVSRECKKAGWKYTGTKREEAQLAWARLVTASGGDAMFCTGEGSL